MHKTGNNDKISVAFAYLQRRYPLSVYLKENARKKSFTMFKKIKKNTNHLTLHWRIEFSGSESLNPVEYLGKK